MKTSIFKCGGGSLQRSREGRRTYKSSPLKYELRKLKRHDVIFVLDQQKGKTCRRVLELHGRQYMQLRINRADPSSDNQLTLKICFNMHEELWKYQKLLTSAIHFCDEVVLFHSLERHFKTVQTILSDTMYANKHIKYEPLGRYFEMCKEMTVYHVENVAESLRQQLGSDANYAMELLRFSNCHLMETHIHAMSHLLMHVARLDLTGNDAMSPKALQVLSHDLSKLNNHTIKLFNLSCCNLTDAHFVPLQSALQVIEQVDLSYNEDLSPLAMKMITSSIQLADASNTMHHLSRLVLSGCNLRDEHIKQLYNCINRLESLDLSGNTKLTPVSMKVISDSLTESKTQTKLKVLKLENCGISFDHIEELMHCIHLLRELDLSWNELSITCVQLISASILVIKKKENMFCLQSLNLTGCELTDDHVIHLVDSMTSIREVHLGYNKLATSNTAKIVAAKFNDVSEKEEENLLQVLTLCSIEVTADDVSMLIENGKGILQNIDLTQSQLNDGHVEKIRDCLHFLVEVHFCDNPNLTESAAKLISNAIVERSCNNLNLKLLDFRKCHLKDIFIEHLAPCLKYIEVLDISYNSSLSPVAMKLISDSQSSQFCLKELKIAASGFKDSHLVNLNGCYVRLEKLDIGANNFTYITMLAIKNDVTECKPSELLLKELHIHQAFSLRDYHYRKFENDLKCYNIQVVSVTM